MRRIKTGIRGFDALIKGGIPENSSLLVCGSPGTGKSIMALEYIYHGAEQNEPGLYVTIEEKPEKLKDQALQFGWNFSDLEKKKKVKFLKIPVDEVNVDIFSLIEKGAKEIKAKRIVIDSLSILAINAPMYRLPIKVAAKDSFVKTDIQPSSLSGSEEIQQFIYIFVSRVNDLDATVLFIADSPQIENYLTRDTVSEFACDGVVQLKTMTMGKTFYRTFEIKKMRNTPVEPGIHIMEFDNKGIILKPFEY